MKLPILWLKDYIEVTDSAEKLAELLTLSGSKVEEVTGHGLDSVIDIEVTSNRPDCLSMLGLAVEVSAVCGKKVKVPSEYLNKKEKSSAKSAKKSVTIEVLDKKACPYYSARLIEGVSIKSSSAELQKLLTLMGTRFISNVVDVTNYVLFECGQPLHAFDWDKIEGKKIIVRRSKAGEKFLALDGVEHTLDDQTLVIADEMGPVALAGVMGGKRTEVSVSTKNILLESAYFDPALVRQACRKYKISTESSYRFERGVNPEYISKASDRALSLIQKDAGGVDVSSLVEKNYFAKKSLGKISVSISRLEVILGIELNAAKCKKILEVLGFKVLVSGKDKLTVYKSHHRPDVNEDYDVAEEILRIEGFDKAQIRIPSTRYSENPIKDLKAEGVFALKKYMANIGFDEIMTYSLLSGKKISDSGVVMNGVHRMVNTLSLEQEYFRPNLLPGMLESVIFNVHRKAHSLRFFEIGNRYLNNKEQTILSVGIYGDWEKNWAKKNQSTFYDLKGVVENVFDFLNLKNVRVEEGQIQNYFSSALQFVIGQQSIGSCGEIKASVLKNWDIPGAFYYAEIILDELFVQKQGVFKVSPIAKFPLVSRDIAFVIDQKISVKELEELILRMAAPYISQVYLFDQYIGKNIPSGKRSLAFSLVYQNPDGTFTDAQIQALQQKVTEALKSQFLVEFR